MIGVIDYRAGNAPSVMYALERLGLDARLVAEPAELADVDRLILPGRRRRPRHARVARRVRPRSSRCGPACSTTRSRSSASASGSRCSSSAARRATPTGLGWLQGEVRRFPDTDRVPADRLERGALHAATHPVTAGLPDPTYCYFVNSYYAVPAERRRRARHHRLRRRVLLGRRPRATSIATQFHAEKSGELGLRLLRGFAAWDGAGC